jgi:predicted HAD superfamily hydrolase
MYKQIQSKSIKIISFDVFDTALTRFVGQPKGIFLLMGCHLHKTSADLPRDFIDHFCEYRIEAETSVRKQKGSAEICLAEIYQELMRSHYLKPSTGQRLAELEMALEKSTIVGVPAIVAIIKRYRDLGKKVIFVSDMYLPSSAIINFLKSEGLFNESDTLYVSSEVLETKREGGLFRLILERERCQPQEMLHIGDNLYSDVASASRWGIRSHHFKETALNRYEKILLGNADLPGQLLAGAARIARLRMSPSESENCRVLFGLGASVAGPMFTAYVLWIREKARQLGVKRLYFLARDGQVLYEIAKLLFDESELELRYLYGSRQAWHLPALTEITDYELRWLTIFDPHLTIKILAGRVQLDPKIICEALQEEGLRKDLDSTFSSQEICQLKKILQAENNLSKLIKENASTLRRNAIGYFRQEGLFDEISWALVDLGWFGNMQESLEKILLAAGHEISVCGFYFGLRKDPLPGKLKYPFLFSPAASNADEFNIGSCFVPIAELLACADHGSSICYQFHNEKYSPVLKDNIQWLEEWGFHHLRAGIIEFVKNLRFIEHFEGNDMRKRIFELMKAVFFSPGRKESSALGNYLFSSDQGESVMRKFAPPFNIWDSLKYIRNFRTARKFQTTFWLHGSRKRSNRFVNMFLRGCAQIAGMLGEGNRFV